MSNYLMGKELTSKEVCEYLRISRWTLYRLIKKGNLPAVKQARDWCFKRREVETYCDYRDLIHPNLLFHDTVLQKYFIQPQKYRITLRGRIGWLAPRRPAEFKKIKYQKVRWRGTIAAIIIQPKYFTRLPPKHQQAWLRFKIPT